MYVHMAVMYLCILDQRTHVHTYVRMWVHVTCMCTYIHISMHPLISSHTPTPTHTHTHTHAYTHIHTHTHTHTHAHAHTHTHTHTHTTNQMYCMYVDNTHFREVNIHTYVRTCVYNIISVTYILETFALV